MARTYPDYHDAVVGLSPGTMKRLSPADMKALCEAFYAATIISDPLDPAVDIAAEWEVTKKRMRKITRSA